MDKPQLVRLEEEYYTPWAEYVENGERKFIFHTEPIYSKEQAFRIASGYYSRPNVISATVYHHLKSGWIMRYPVRRENYEQ